MKYWATIFICLISSTQASYGREQCQPTQNFQHWLQDFKHEAREQGVSNTTLKQAFKDITPDKKVLARDRRQAIFSDPFTIFANKLVAKYRLQKGKKLIKKHATLFKQIEKKYGVPASVITAFWGLETDFGAYMGNFDTIRSLTTLAYDCRRPEIFRPQLIAALKLLQSQEVKRHKMKGAWAGELGQVQFLPQDYLERAIDFDGDGKRDLFASVPDILASAANLIRFHGWKPRQPWLREVRLPKYLPWKEAGIDIKHPLSQWKKWGVKAAHGKLPHENLSASLILPMGRLGPAFLAFDNFDIYLKWNQSLIYTLTAAWFATRLESAQKLSPGRGAPLHLNVKTIKQMQKALQERGFNVGGIDGTMGAKTRAAIKQMQLNYNLPADSYPSRRLLSLLKVPLPEDSQNGQK